MRVAWILILTLLLAGTALANTWDSVDPTIDRVLIYGDSTCDTPQELGVIPIERYGTDNVGLACISGAWYSPADSPVLSLEEQSVNPGGGCLYSADLWGAGSVPTCIQDISPALDVDDVVIFHGGINESSGGALLNWDTDGRGARFEAALDAMLTELATFAPDTKCIVVSTLAHKTNESRTDIIRYKERYRQLRSIANNHPKCIYSQALEHWEAYLDKFGTEPYDGLYVDGDSIHPETIIPNSLGQIGARWLSQNVDASIGRAFAVDVPLATRAPGASTLGNTDPIVRPLVSDRRLYEDFSTVNPLIADWTATNSGTWAAGVGMTDNDTTGDFWFFRNDPAVTVSKDTSCLIGHLNVNLANSFAGCLLRVDPTNYGASKHVSLIMRGNATIEVYEMTGNTITNAVFLDGNVDFGNVGNGNYVGFTISGSGGDTLVKAYIPIAADVQGQEFNADNWGTCIASFREDAADPGCVSQSTGDADQLVDWSAGTEFESGFGHGIYVKDAVNDASHVGVIELWMSDLIE